MANFDPRVDEYIRKSADFAKPILEHIRALVHQACPEVQETMKWSMPHFEYKGNLCHMASFKQHCAFGFWKASMMKDNKKLFEPLGETAMGHLGKISSLKDLPSDKTLLSYLKEAVKLNDEGVKIPKQKTAPKEAPVSDELLKAIGKNKMAKLHFEEFSPSAKKDYFEWINEAKTAETKNKRIATAVEWISEGKKRHWKYQR